MTGRDRLIVAIDVASLPEAFAFIDRIGEAANFFKVGLELVCGEGPQAISALAARGRIFLDLKLHDIPETIARTLGGLRGSGAELVSVHASGGRAMMRRAADVAHAAGIK